MEEALDKLRLLGYDKEKGKKMPHLTKVSFVTQPKNAMEAFTNFAAVMNWLLHQAEGKDLGEIKPYDDPNAACNDMLKALKEAGFAQPSFPAGRLKQGYGDAHCAILNSLADLALAKAKYKFAKPSHPSPMPEEEEEEEDEAEDEPGSGDREDDGDEEGEDEEEEYGAALEEEEEGAAAGKEGGADQEGEESEREMLESKVDPEAWREEVERVAPSLKVKVAGDAKDWRGHLEKAREALERVGYSLPDAKKLLNGVVEEVQSTLEKVRARERMVNSELSKEAGTYMERREVLKDLESKHSTSWDAGASLRSELEEVGARLEEAKRAMAERGDAISDSSPIVRLQQARDALKQDLRLLDIKLGVARSSFYALDSHLGPAGRKEEEEEEEEEESEESAVDEEDEEVDEDDDESDEEEEVVTDEDESQEEVGAVDDGRAHPGKERESDVASGDEEEEGEGDDDDAF